jgi:hypothetical protein
MILLWLALVVVSFSSPILESCWDFAVPAISILRWAFQTMLTSMHLFDSQLALKMSYSGGGNFYTVPQSCVMSDVFIHPVQAQTVVVPGYLKV